ncbi:MAG: prolyl oligopeptidase family serine peptidase [Terriglobia bacterium]|jgi:prolyl oligopeptidase
MYKDRTLAGSVALILAVSSVAFAQQVAPTTREDDFRESFHGVEIVDPYHWLEDSESSATRKWVDEQNSYAHGLLDPQPIRSSIVRRLTEMMRHDRLGAPLQRNGYYYFDKREADREQWAFYRRKATGGPDELLIDPDLLSPDHTASVSTFGVSEDGALWAYGVRQGGEDEMDLRVLDVARHRDLKDHLPKALYVGFAFKKDGSGFYYSVGHRDVGKRLYYHTLGSDPSQDVEIFGKGYGTDTWISPLVSETGRYLLILVQRGWANGELFLQDLETGGLVRPLVTGLDAKFNPSFAEDSLIVQTDWKAPKSRILKIDLRDPRPEKWREIVPEGEDAIEDSAVVGGKLFVQYLHNVVSRIDIFSLEGRRLGEVPLPGLGSAGLYGRADQKEGILHFSSYTVPYSIYRYDTETGTQSLWHRDSVPFESDRFESERIWYSSKDGTKIPMFLVHRKGVKPDVNTPTILYGYGGFNVSLTPFFNPSAAWWIEHGGLYAVANLRGGGEFGEPWHRAGMLEKKQNVFDDFIAGAEWLIREKYTKPEKLAIWGGSNGGLLVAAALTQRPDLYRAVICWHPDLDMIRYYKYTKNNNPPALLEYGNAGDPDQFKFLHAYSPYEHVRQGMNYPAVLLESGDADTRVPPEQARKMAARLQVATASNRPILLVYDTKAGHAGGQPFTKQVEDSALELTFVSWQLGLK